MVSEAGTPYRYWLSEYGSVVQLPVTWRFWIRVRADRRRYNQRGYGGDSGEPAPLARRAHSAGRKNKTTASPRNSVS